MKQLTKMLLAWLAASIAYSCFAQPIGSVQNHRELQDQNKALVRAYLDEISNKGNLSAISKFFADDVVFNGSRDLEQLVRRRKALATAFPDHHLVVLDQIAEDDKVVTRVVFRGTHLGDFNGIPATGKSVEYSGIAIDRVVNSKVLEMWHITNTQALMAQIGAGVR